VHSPGEPGQQRLQRSGDNHQCLAAGVIKLHLESGVHQQGLHGLGGELRGHCCPQLCLECCNVVARCPDNAAGRQFGVSHQGRQRRLLLLQLRRQLHAAGFQALQELL
jgi:hypothetical protein